MSRGSSNEAAMEYEKVRDYYPDSVNGLNNLGIIYGLQGRTSDAIPLFLRAQALDPSDPLPVTNLGNIYYDLGRMNEAIEFFERAVEMEPRGLRMFNLGDVYLEVGDGEAAEEWFEKAVAAVDAEIAAGGRRGMLLALRALTNAKLGRHAEAEEDLNEALRLEPGHKKVLFMSAQVCALAAKKREMLAAVERALEAGHERDRFLSDSSFDAYREDAQFRALVEGSAGV